MKSSEPQSANRSKAERARLESNKNFGKFTARQIIYKSSVKSQKSSMIFTRELSGFDPVSCWRQPNPYTLLCLAVTD
ncbi:hypothetical protein VARIO8X_150106 [Burkholderiales bacterium 8X]|nr:hypothetical protein VARIO8X_150106 [Burkholderiales bacterium 8X]